MNDTERLNKLQELTQGYGKGWVLRESSTGRGMRLHETSQPNAEPDIRDAIDKFIVEKGFTNPSHCTRKSECTHPEYCEKYVCNWDKRGRE